MHDFKFSIFLTHGYYSYRSLTIVYVKSYKLIKMADVGILSRILEIQRSRVSKDPDMDNVFLSLLSKGFFSKFEEKQILNAIDPEDRTNILLDKVSRKPGSFRDICLALEEYAPHLLTHLLLDIGGWIVNHLSVIFNVLLYLDSFVLCFKVCNFICCTWYSDHN